MTRPFVLLLALLACSPARAASAGTAETITVPVRGRSVPLTIYIPPAGAPQRGTVIMGSGDVGWVGLSVTAAEFLLSQGYIVAGVNVRRYLSDFTSGSDHVTVDQIGQDYRAFAQYLKSRQLLRDPVVLSGVSEGAALAVAAGAA